MQVIGNVIITTLVRCRTLCFRNTKYKKENSACFSILYGLLEFYWGIRKECLIKWHYYDHSKKKPTHSTNIRSKVFGKAHKINKTSMGWPYEYFKISEKYFDITRLLHTLPYVHNSMEKYSCIIIYEIPYSSWYSSTMTKVWSP